MMTTCNSFSQWFCKREAYFHGGWYTSTNRYSVWKIIPKTVWENYWRNTTTNDVSRNTCSDFNPDAGKGKVERSSVWPRLEETFRLEAWRSITLWYIGTTGQYSSSYYHTRASEDDSQPLCYECHVDNQKYMLSLSWGYAPQNTIDFCIILDASARRASKGYWLIQDPYSASFPKGSSTFLGYRFTGYLQLLRYTILMQGVVTHWERFDSVVELETWNHK